MTCFPVCCRRKSSPPRHQIDIEEEVSSIQNAKLYSYKELCSATGDFSPLNKIGEGGFGAVYKGRLGDGTLAAIKVLSAESRQGVKEFLTEIVVISGLEHENLVKLHGCCVEGEHRILVYGYLENNSLAQTLLGSGSSGIQFSWSARARICIGVARGLAFLHEEVQPPIIHRDIKASNILLDKDFTPKISDFGLAKLFPQGLTHISTRVAGTPGYLAPEYVIRSQLTRKADIYSFEILLLEIVSGRSNTNKRLPIDDQYLLETAWRFYQKGEPVELVDISLGENFNVDEACRYIKIALLCTHFMPNSRPSMSSVVKMLTGEEDVDDTKISEPGLLTELVGFRNRKKKNLQILSAAGSGNEDKSPWNTSICTTQATMTFTSISDRST
ncbi:cold-responsive protein kinase 1-like [Ipomoea triloba]|uniref:cold-responsive protein kinase 1-like n=1 Tax=Ipomoea triloba TaxID=35885 RepID=UPI00125D38A0|nr:cold-responsive protein kinase 1-like [Ipomoea triloba]